MLSRLAVFENPKLMMEQYATDSEATAEALWFAYMSGDIAGKIIADFGCGTGLFGIATLLLGACKVYFVDIDSEALRIAGQNITTAAPTVRNFEIINSDVAEFDKKVHTVLQNPPFGTKAKHADRQFLLQAFKIASVVYSFHKIETSDFVRKIAADNGFRVTNIVPMQLQLKATYEFHKSRMKRVEVGLFRIQKTELLLHHHRKPFK